MDMTLHILYTFALCVFTHHCQVPGFRLSKCVRLCLLIIARFHVLDCPSMCVCLSRLMKQIPERFKTGNISASNFKPKN